jgi:hypothetical protein
MALKWIFLMSALVCLVASCDEETLATLNGKWKLAHYYNDQAATTDANLLSSGGSIVLSFSDDGKVGTIMADSIQGQVMGIYEIGLRNRFSFRTLENDFQGNNWSRALLDRISRADFVKISANTLSISCDEGREVLLFVRDN